MSNSVSKQNASVISLFLYVLKHSIHCQGSLGCVKHRGIYISNEKADNSGESDLQFFFHLIIRKDFGYEDHYAPLYMQILSFWYNIVSPKKIIIKNFHLVLHDSLDCFNQKIFLKTFQ
jgi:hypothetical protein